eukprot:m.10442 g.10442  ORF g.10442 m.10442 type:complete len:432 (-) comp2746_c0_seq1:221-1516(-)
MAMQDTTQVLHAFAEVASGHGIIEGPHGGASAAVRITCMDVDDDDEMSVAELRSVRIGSCTDSLSFQQPVRRHRRTRRRSSCSMVTRRSSVSCSDTDVSSRPRRRGSTSDVWVTSDSIPTMRRRRAVQRPKGGRPPLYPTMQQRLQREISDEGVGSDSERSSSACSQRHKSTDSGVVTAAAATEPVMQHKPTDHEPVETTCTVTKSEPSTTEANDTLLREAAWARLGVHVSQSTGLRSGQLSLHVRVPGYGLITRTVAVTVRTTAQELVQMVLDKIPYLSKLYPSSAVFETCMMESGQLPYIVADYQQPLTMLLRWSPARIGKFLDQGQLWLRLNSSTLKRSSLSQPRLSRCSAANLRIKQLPTRSLSEPRSTRLSLLWWKDPSQQKSTGMSVRHGTSLDASPTASRRMRWWRPASHAHLNVPPRHDISEI